MTNARKVHFVSNRSRKLTFLFVCIFLRTDSVGQSFNGKVIEASECYGIARLNIRLSPAQGAPDNTELITSTDAGGRFSVNIQGSGKYFLRIAQGLTQVYANEITVDPKRPILIPFRRTADEVFSPLCLADSPGGRLPGNVRPIGLALLPSGMLVLDGNGDVLWQGQSAGFVRLREFGMQGVKDIVTSKVAGEDVVFVLTNPLGRGALTMYSTGAQKKEEWDSPWIGRFTGFAVGANQAIYTVFADDPNGKSFTILKLDLSVPSPKFQEVAHLRNMLGLRIGPVAVDVQHNRLFAVDDFKGDLYQVDLATRHTQEIALAHEIHEPRALALDASSQNLYVAAAGHLWKIRLDTGGARAPMQDFGRPNIKFKSSTSLAIDQNNNVWVGDEYAHAIYLLRPEGQVVGTVPAVPH